MAIIFDYKAKDRQGNTITGKAEGDDKTSVVRRLKAEGYLVTSIEEDSSSSGGMDLANIRLFERLNMTDLAYFCRQFYLMVNAGIALMNTLGLLAEQMEKVKMKEILYDILDRLQKGESFSEALAHHNYFFSNFFIELVGVGEIAGVLDSVMGRLADYYQRELTVRSKVKSALLYPMVLFGISVLIIVILLTFVVPMFVSMFAGMGVSLPLPTRLVIGAKDILIDFWYVFIVFVIALPFIYKKLIKIPKVKRIADLIVLRVPKLGDMTKKVDISRFARTVATLNSSGITLLRSLEITSKVVSNTIISEILLEARDNLERGVTLSQSLKRSKLFPAMVIQMVAVGEETGAIEEVMNKVGEFYDDEVEKAVEAFISIIEPLMIVFVAVVVGFVVLSIYLPMFEVIMRF